MCENMTECAKQNWMENGEWAYGMVNVAKLNVRRQPSTKARRWSNVWPMGRIALVREVDDIWYETLYRGQKAFVMRKYITLLETRVHEQFVDRMLFMVSPEEGRQNAVYFNGYGGEWCHRFADWLVMNAGVPLNHVPNTANCGKGVGWFVNDVMSNGFYFKNAEHKCRMIKKYRELQHLQDELTLEELTYTPEPGDYVYFRWNNANKYTCVNHVGIVSEVTSDKIGTWEGNCKKRVVSRAFCKDDAQILGYGRIDYGMKGK